MEEEEEEETKVNIKKREGRTCWFVIIESRLD
jgi:hypothetical protein